MCPQASVSNEEEQSSMTDIIQDVSWHINGSCVLTGFAYHDGFIVELRYFNSDHHNIKSTRTLDMVILNLDSQLVHVTFSGVHHINISNVIDIPIILDILVLSNNLDMNHDQYCSDFWDILLPSEYYQPSDRAKSINSINAKQQNAHYIRVFASYGCDIALICDSIRVSI